MKFEEWLAVLGFFAVIAAMVVAILPDRLWQTQTFDAGRIDGGAWVGVVPNVPTGGRVAAQGLAQSVTVAAFQPQTNTPMPTTRRAQPGLVPFEQAARVRFSGAIQQISEMQQQDGQIHVWLTDALGKEHHLSVAPSWFLHYMGCTLVHDAAISGVGFQFSGTQKDALTYVKKLVIGKKVCHLRNDEGFALWSNQLR